jgi:hypothetical protein
MSLMGNMDINKYAEELMNKTKIIDDKITLSTLVNEINWTEI